MEKNGTARQATDDYITRRMLFACWITKATYEANPEVFAQAVCWLFGSVWLTAQRNRVLSPA